MNFDEDDFARMIERTGGDDSPRSAHQEQLRRQVLEAFDRAQAGTSRTAFITSLLDHGRWIMRHPVSRVAAAAIFLLALGAVAVWFHGAGATPALADFLRPILDAKSVKFKATTQGQGQTVHGEVMVLAPNRMRQEIEMPGKLAGIKMVTIMDFDKGKSVTLSPAAKLAIVTDITSQPKEKPKGNLSKNLFLELRSQLRDPRQRPDFKREPLGEKDIDGRRLVGYRLTGHGMLIDVWGDPKTGMPIQVDTTAPLNPDFKTTWSDFVFDVELDESLFSVEPPAGYTTQNVKADYSPGEEKDLVETFRRYSQLSGGAFPDSFNLSAILQLAMKKSAASVAKKGAMPNEQQMQQMMDETMKLARGLGFIEQLPPHANAHYAGKGVSQGKADTPIFWYRPKDAQKYRVIYADLSVRDADTAPNVPNAQPVPGPAGTKK